LRKKKRNLPGEEIENTKPKRIRLCNLSQAVNEHHNRKKKAGATKRAEQKRDVRKKQECGESHHLPTGTQRHHLRAGKRIKSTAGGGETIPTTWQRAETQLRNATKPRQEQNGKSLKRGQQVETTGRNSMTTGSGRLYEAKNEKYQGGTKTPPQPMPTG